MLPQVWPGDMLTIGRKDPALVQPGELVLYLRNDRLFVHRLLRHDLCRMLITKGDSIPRPDLPVPHEDVLGVVTEICHRGVNRAPSRNPGLLSRVLAVLFAKSTAAQSIALRLAAFTAGSLPLKGPASQAMPCDPTVGR